MSEDVPPAGDTRARHAPAAVLDSYAQSAPLVPALLADAARTWPQQTALEFQGKTYRYRDVWQLACRVAHGLQSQLGVAAGHRVGLLLPNTPYYPILYYGVLLAGAAVVNLNPLYAEREIDRIVRDSQLTALATLNLTSLYPRVAGRLSDSGLQAIIACPMGDILPLPKRAAFALARRRETAAIPDDDRHLSFPKLIHNDGRPSPPDAGPTDLAVLQYTGGTTGIPKGAMLSHGNIYANARQTVQWGETARFGQEKMLGVLPLFHAFGMTAVMNAGFMLGATLILRPRFRSPEILDVIQRQKATLMMGVPTMYDALNRDPKVGEHDLSSLHFAISGGAPLKAAIQESFEAHTGCRLVEGYGLSEASPIVTCNPVTVPNQPGSVGLPYPDTDIAITDPQAPARPVTPETVGEIRVAGPQVMQGYWDQGEETAEALRDGYLRTGDLGYVDASGYLYIVDRLKDIILVGGFNVYPRMVEEAIELHPDIAEAAVFGVADSHHGEAVHAVVRREAESELTAAALRRFLKDKLASFEQPRRIQFRTSLPRTNMGKPDRRALRAAAERPRRGAGEEKESPA